MPTIAQKKKMDQDEFMRLIEGAPKSLQKPLAIQSEAEASTASNISEKQTIERAPKCGNTEDRYKTKYLQQISIGTAGAAAVRLPGELYLRLKRIVTLVFDGKVSMTAFVTNILNDHIEKHKELYDSIYKPKNWNE